MSLQIDSTAIPASDSVELTLPDDILSYSFDADGITVTEVQTDRIHFHVKPVERLGFFNICANYADGTIGEDTIYFFRDYDMTFVSNFTLDDAFHKGMQFLLEQGTITTYEYEQKYAELTQNYISTFDINSTGHTPVDMETAEALTITTSTTSNTISVSGYAYWKPSSNTVLPLKYAKISFLELTNLGYNELDNVYTDLNGYFSFEIDISDLFLPVGDTSLCIRILPESTTINVYNPGTYAYYEYSLPGAPSIGEEYSIGGLLLQNSEDMTFYRLLYIHQCMLVGERFA